METYWLVGWLPGDVPAIGADRIKLDDAAAVAGLRSKLDKQHPRLLMSFKSDLLIADEGEDDYCGTDEELPLAGSGELRFDGDPFELSACGAALLDRAPAPGESLPLWLAALAEAEASGWPESERSLLLTAADWARQGRIIVLLKEGH